MSTTVFLSVLAAALMHASWNAMVKGGGDRFVSIMAIAAGHGVAGLILLPVVAAPASDSWPLLILSAILHAGYKLFLMQAYRLGDMGQVYPIARGAAPLLTGAIGVAALGEYLSATQTLGLVAVGLGVMAVGLRGAAQFSAAPVGLALVTALFTTGYTLADGYGARLAGTALGFIAWMYLFDAALCVGAGYWLAGRGLTARMAAQWRIGLIGGGLSIGSYAVAAWAMTQAPIALVAALRESSVLFALAISVFILREPPLPARLIAGAAIVAGLGLMRAG